MTQQIINTGNVSNDGTGESLRNAFIAVNDNFTQIWASGPVNSQVVITNNVISTNVTNLPLVLEGNGTATITVNSTIVPSIDSVYDIGSPSKRVDSIYAQYYYGNGAFLTGISGGGGGGNVTFSNTAPSTANIGDVWIESDTGVQYIYFNDNSSNQWAEMEAFQSFGVGQAGNGGNIDLTQVASDIIPSANIGYNIGNATNQWDNLWVGNTVYINSVPLTATGAGLKVNGATVLTTASNISYNNLSVTGNIRTNALYTNNYFYANGAPFVAGGNVLPNSTIRIAGNTISTTVLNQNLTLAANGLGAIQANSTIIPSLDRIYDIGSLTNRISVVYAGNFVGDGSALTGITANAVLSGNLVGNLRGNGYGANAFSFISATGNITGQYFIGNGSQLTGITATALQGNLSGNLTGNGFGANAFSFVSATGNITGQYFIGNGAYLTGISGGSANTGNIGFIGDAIYDLNGLIIENADLSHGATAALILPANGNSSNPAQLNNTYGNIQITTGTDPGHLKTWVFGNDGTLTSPGNILSNGVMSVTGNGVTTGLVISQQFLAAPEQTGVTWNGYVFSGDAAQTGMVQRQGRSTTVSLIATGAEVVRVTPGGANIFGYISASGNVQVANLLTGGSISATGNVTGGNVIGNNISATSSFSLTVYADATARDTAISGPTPGMMIYVTGTGMQVRGATSWNTIAGSGT